ncbi:hypothetical protein D9M71_525320 [compost metagenome]
MSLWINPLQTGAQHRHRPPAGIQRPEMGGTIDTQRQPAGDAEAAAGQAAGEGVGTIQAGAAGAAAADHGQLRLFEQRAGAGDEQQRRGIRQFGEQGGIVGGVPHQQIVVRRLQPAQDAVRLLPYLGAAPLFGGFHAQSQRTPRGGRRAQCSRRRAEGGEQLAEASRPQFRQGVQAQACLQFGR